MHTGRSFRSNTVTIHKGESMSKKQLVYSWLDQHGDHGEKTRQMIVQATGMNSVTVKSYLQDWRRKKKQQPSEGEPSLASFSCEQLELEPTKDHNRQSEEKKSIREVGSAPFTQEEISALKQIITERTGKREAVNGLTYKITGVTKPFTFSLEIKLEKEFGLVCQKLNISKRRAVHLALQEFTDRYG